MIFNMNRSDENEFFKFCCCVFTIIIIYISGLVVGISTVQIQAADRGCAEFMILEDGSKQFRWKDSP